ncbi:MAG: (d)CMP kinase [Saprospiraceae bacterium]|nr:(d)CMP kinase [Saprospiraceae bacterium]MBK8296351.1 (d)CMP kinase [Saprospiraceae bacterium]
MHMIIAVDGFSACGKSTLAKDLAIELNIVYIDSGAMYRAITLYYLEQKKINPDLAIEDLPIHQIQIDFIPGLKPQLLLNNKDVTEEIRQPIVSDLVSEVSAVSKIRKAMVDLQRKIATGKSIIMDGRDIGSVVFPNADVKLFVTAEIDTRAHRRYSELKQRGIQQSIEQIKSNLIKRDQIDSTRKDSPLIQTEDAILLDNSHLNREQQKQFALHIIRTKLTKNCN